MLKLLKRILALDLDNGQGHFLVKESGKFYFPPLFLALIIFEFSHYIFAIDSFSVISAITDEPLIVVSSNTMAIIGLRFMYIILIGLMDNFSLIKYGLTALLAFCRIKNELVKSCLWG